MERAGGGGLRLVSLGRSSSRRADGQLAIVCPIGDDSTTRGIGVFVTELDETRRLMDADPAVQAGIFRYELHLCRSFPGDALP